MLAVRAETSVYGPERPSPCRARARSAAAVGRPPRPQAESVRPRRAAPAGVDDVALPTTRRRGVGPLRLRPRRRHPSRPHRLSAAARGVADHRVARDEERRATTGSPTSPPKPRALARLARLRWTIELDYRQLKGELGLDHYEGAATSASTTTARSSPARTPSSPSSGSTQKPRGRPDTAAGGAAPAARPPLLGRPLPHLQPTRRPRPAQALHHRE